MGKIEFWKNKKGLFNYHIKGRNGQVLAEIKQGFTRKAGMMKNIQALERCFQYPGMVARMVQINAPKA